jgi:uncharacterized repeat protein (TIGR03803 family)
MRFSQAFALATLLLVPLPSGASPVKASSRLLYSFSGGTDGAGPAAVLISTADGALYGTTAQGGNCTVNAPYGCGTVFKLTPPRNGAGAWTEKVLHAFRGGRDGLIPLAPLVADGLGNFYGTTQRGGLAQSGNVFKLSATGAGYSETILHEFSGGSDGLYPSSGLLIDKSGALYGETNQGGAGYGMVYKLTPPAAKTQGWTKCVLHAFTSGSDGALPAGGLIADANGALYGVTLAAGLSNGYGTVFKLTPPLRGNTAWTESVLYAFPASAAGHQPNGPLIPGSGGVLYGSTYFGGVYCGNGSGGVGCGTVFRLTPPAPGKTRWTESVLYSFGNFSGGNQFSPAFLNGSLVMDSHGALYGTANSGGTGGVGAVFELTPPAAGSAIWTETDLLEFAGTSNGANPQAGLLAKGTTLYGTAETGGAHGFGAVFLLTEP